MDKATIFPFIPQCLPEEIFETIVSSSTVKIERIVSKGHASPENFWYDQDCNEWVLLLKGKAALEFEGAKEIILEPGDYLTIPSHVRHRVAWTDADRESVWLAVHYRDI